MAPAVSFHRRRAVWPLANKPCIAAVRQTAAKSLPPLANRRHRTQSGHASRGLRTLTPYHSRVSETGEGLESPMGGRRRRLCRLLAKQARYMHAARTWWEKDVGGMRDAAPKARKSSRCALFWPSVRAMWAISKHDRQLPEPARR